LAKLGTAVERLLGIKYPVLLGGMAGITDHALTSAVSEAGGGGTGNGGHNVSADKKNPGAHREAFCCKHPHPFREGGGTCGGGNQG